MVVYPVFSFHLNNGRTLNASSLWKGTATENHQQILFYVDIYMRIFVCVYRATNHLNKYICVTGY